MRDILAYGTASIALATVRDDYTIANELVKMNTNMLSVNKAFAAYKCHITVLCYMGVVQQNDPFITNVTVGGINASVLGAIEHFLKPLVRNFDTTTPETRTQWRVRIPAMRRTEASVVETVTRIVRARRQRARELQRSAPRHYTTELAPWAHCSIPSQQLLSSSTVDASQ